MSKIDIDFICCELKNAGFSQEERNYVRKAVNEHDALVEEVGRLNKLVVELEKENEDLVVSLQLR